MCNISLFVLLIFHTCIFQSVSLIDLSVHTESSNSVMLRGVLKGLVRLVRTLSVEVSTISP